MGYLYLFISLITGATKGLFGKKVSTLVTVQDNQITIHNLTNGGILVLR